MKIFIVDIQNCIDLNHYETFFYEEINDGLISLCRYPISSLSELGRAKDWLTEEINRNPFQLSHGLVVFLVPRDFTSGRILSDYDSYIKMYIHELVERRVEPRFKYVCIYVDCNNREVSSKEAYENIKNVCENFRSSDPQLQAAFLPDQLPGKVDTLEEIESAIEQICDEPIRAFYRRVLDDEKYQWNLLVNLPKNNNLPHKEYEYQYESNFLSECNRRIAPIRIMNIRYSIGDIRNKIECDLKIVEYIRAASRTDIADFDDATAEFWKQQNFDGFHINTENVSAEDDIRVKIATYKKRLEEWQKENPKDKHQEKSEVYMQTDHSTYFDDEMQKISAQVILSATSDIKDSSYADLDITELVINSLDNLLKNASELLKKFCEDRIAEFREFWRKNPEFETAAAEDIDRSELQKKAEEELAAAMNQYTVNELPGFSAELRLRQQLDLVGKKIKQIGIRLKAMSAVSFLGTLLFAFLSIACFYGGAEYSIFVKEQTWDVFGFYCLAVAVLFLLSYGLLMIYYHKKVRNLLAKCQLIVDEFLENYKNRAIEFEKNINAAMMYYCEIDANNKDSLVRSEDNEILKKLQWHEQKIKAILKNLQIFDGFIMSAEPVQETSIPKLAAPFENDAMHSPFYFMKIYN